MRIALVSDIHSNLPALEAVLADARAAGAESYICAGDVVGFGPHPKGCVDAVRATFNVVVAGNHDRAMGKGEDPRCAPQLAPAAAASEEVARGQLDGADLAWLRALPHEESLYLANRGIYVVHGTPRDPYHTGIKPEVDPQTLRMELFTVDADVVITGHTHRPMVLRGLLPDVSVVNPGSVGMPLDGDPGASYALLDTDDGAIHPRRLPYDVESVVADLAYLGEAERALLGFILRNGRWP